MNCAQLERTHPCLARLGLARRRSGELGRQHRRPRQVCGLRLQRLHPRCALLLTRLFGAEEGEGEGEGDCEGCGCGYGYD